MDLEKMKKMIAEAFDKERAEQESLINKEMKGE